MYRGCFRLVVKNEKPQAGNSVRFPRDFCLHVVKSWLLLATKLEIESSCFTGQIRDLCQTCLDLHPAGRK